jgi:hypothetical protein
VWSPPLENNPADIVQWTIDQKHWHNGRPNAADAKRVRVVHWVAGDYLRPGMSTAFAFQLRLTGPYSDRTGDLNATRDPAARPVIALNETQVAAIQRSVLHITSAIAEPFALGGSLWRPSARLDDGSAGIVVRNGVRYSVKATAYVRDADGDVHALPLAKAHPQPGDRVRYTFIAHNTSDGPRQAGATFNLPAGSRFAAVMSSDGLIDVSDDGGMHWRRAASAPAGSPRNVRYVHRGRLAPDAAGGFAVDVEIVAAPVAQATAKPDPGSLDALSASAIRSFFFTRDLASGKRVKYDGFTLTPHLEGIAKQAAGPGFVTSGATPMPTPMPIEAQERTQRSNMLLIVAGGAFLFFTIFIMLQMRGSRESPPDTPTTRGSYKSNPGPAAASGQGELARDVVARSSAQSDAGTPRGPNERFRR